MGMTSLLGCERARDVNTDGAAATPQVILPRAEELSDSFFGLANPVGAVTDSVGVIFVADAGTSQIHRFAPTGSYEASFGRAGAGPAEFGRIAGIGVHGDSLIVLDAGNARISRLSGAGAELGTEPWVPLSGSPRDIRVYPAECGYFVRTTIPGDRGLRRAYELYCGARRDTVFPPSMVIPGIECIGPVGGIGFKSNPFAPRELATPGFDGGLTTARVLKHRLEVILTTANGDTRLTITDSLSRFPIPPEIRDSVMEARRAFLRSWPDSDCKERGAPEEEAWPALQHIWYAHDGDLVVVLYHPAGSELRIYRQERLVSSVIVEDSPTEEAPFARDGILYLFRQDSLGVSRLEAYEY